MGDTTTCIQCGERFVIGRYVNQHGAGSQILRTKYCGTKCRVTAHRKRVRAGHVPRAVTQPSRGVAGCVTRRSQDIELSAENQPQKKLFANTRWRVVAGGDPGYLVATPMRP